LGRWQLLLSELRDNFCLFTVYPQNLPLSAPMLHSGSELVLDMDRYGVKDPTKRLVPFLLSLSQKSPPFAVLSRYYIHNVITGAHHLFYFYHDAVSKPILYDDVKLRSSIISRHDTRNYLNWYLEFAYLTVGIAPLTRQPYPQNRMLEILRTMKKFWLLTFGPQDTIVVCLEVQQRWLYVSLRQKLMQQWTALKSNDTQTFSYEQQQNH